MKKQAREAAFLSSLFKSVESAKKDKLKAQNPEVLKAEQKIDIYTDQRDQNKGDSMLYWDQAKLEAVIQEKDGQSRANPTEIVCKYFIEALEKRQYGWFWKCPNGGSSCKYRHCLPQGYVLKTVEPDSAKAEEEESLETILERERASLPANGTKVTLETFLAWKKRKQEAKKQEIEEAVRGKKTLSGKDLFTFDKSLFVDDAAAASEDDYVEEEGYWDSVINENQAKLDEANTQAKLDEASTQADAIKKTDVEVPVC